MSVSNKITVIIPTRERADVLTKSLRTVTSQNYDNLEIIVSDNCSQDHTSQVVRDCNDKRVRYLNPGRRLSMSHHWDFALSHIKEGWVTIIGDDDGLLPGALERVAGIIDSHDVQAICSNVCQYGWPGSSAKNLNTGRLRVPLGTKIEVRKTKKWMAKVLGGFTHYTELPILYNGGYVSIKTLLDIKSKSGAFYRSLVPDVYSSIAISSVIESYVYLHEPLAINGGSRHSTGISSFSTDRYDNTYTPATRFISEGNIPCHRDIELFINGRYLRSIQAMVYESYLQSGCLRQEMLKNLHAQQLEVILATNYCRYAEIPEWGMAFAKKHGLDYAKILSRAKHRHVKLEIQKAWREWVEEATTLLLISSDASLSNVYEASLVADGIINAPFPPRFKELIACSRLRYLYNKTKRSMIDIAYWSSLLARGKTE